MKQWKLACYSRKGRSHAKKNKESQDSLDYRRWRVPGSSDVYDFAAVIADGVGSLPNSGFAAKEATSFALDWLQDNSRSLMDANNPEHLLRELLPYVRSKVLRTARMRGISESSMDCNLAFVCVLRSANRVLCGVLGDCAVCILGGEDTVLTDPTSTGSGTHTVLESQSENYLQCCVINDPIQKNVQGFLLTTDGLEGAAYVKNYRHPRKFSSTLFNAALKCGSEAADENTAAGVQQQYDILISNPCRELARLVNSLPANFSDDISVAVISRAESPYVLPDDPQWLCTCGCHTSIFASRCSNCNTSFIDLYKSVTIETDVYDFFRELNKTPDRERKLIGLPPASEPKPPQTPESVHTPGRTRHPRSQESGSTKRTVSSIIDDRRLIVKKGPENSPDPVPTGSSTHPNDTESPKNAPDEQTSDAPKGPKLSKKVLGLIRKHLSMILLFLALIQLTVSVLLFIAFSQSKRNYDQLLERQMAVEEMLGIEYAPTKAPPEEEKELWCVTDSVVFVRDDLYGEKLFQLKRGEQVTVVGDPKTDAQGTQWVYIKHEEHGYGWCQLRSLERLQD